MNNKTIMAMVLVLGCNAEEVESPPTQLTDTEQGLGDTGDASDTGEIEPDECWDQGAPAGAVRWQCEGLAEATVFATLNIEVPDILPNADAIQGIIDAGRWDFAHLFGPWGGEAYDDPGIDACCLPTIGSEDEEGADETGADPTDGGETEIPQAAEACARDCADQACRSVPGTLRDLAGQIPAGVPIVGPSYRNQLLDLANWVAGHQQDCWEAMVADEVDRLGAYYVIHGEWQVPNSESWPNVTDLLVEGSCEVNDWYMPEEGEPQACMGLNDNNEEVPSGSTGTLGAFDTFAPTGGKMELDGPMIFGVPASGTAPVLGLGDTCPRGECSRLDAWITDDALELRRMVLIVPSAMRWERDGLQLTIDGLHVMVEHPISIPLIADRGVMRFEIPVGELEVLFAGQVHRVPVKVVVPNATPVTGTVFPLSDDSHGIVVDPFTIEHHDAFGTWTMRVELGELVALDHAPRVTYEVQHDGSTQRLDGSASFDPDGDKLGFEWYRNGTLIGEGPMITSAPAADGSTPTLRVTDETGRTSWGNGLAPAGT